MIEVGDVYRVRDSLHYVVQHKTTFRGDPVYYLHVYGGDGIAVKRKAKDISRYTLVGRDFKLKS